MRTVTATSLPLRECCSPGLRPPPLQKKPDKTAKSNHDGSNSPFPCMGKSCFCNRALAIVFYKSRSFLRLRNAFEYSDFEASNLVSTKTLGFFSLLPPSRSFLRLRNAFKKGFLRPQFVSSKTLLLKHDYRCQGILSGQKNQRAENGALDPWSLNLRFWGAPIFSLEAPRPLF